MSSTIPPLPIGFKLASNRILHLLGHGGHGATYVVEDVRSESGVSVIKECLPAEHAYREESTLQILPIEATGEAVERLRADQEAFTSEQNALGTIHHPSIVAVSRVFSAMGTTYSTMEYLRGHTLADWCQKNGAPSREQLVYLLSSLLSALACLHAKEVTHGELNENHVRFRENGVPVLIDFGMARKSMQANGNPTALSALKQSAEDLFALGAMARRLITGEKGTPGSRMAPLAKNGRYTSTYGKSLLAGIDKAMDTNEGKGWANASEWLDAVKGRMLSAPARKVACKILWGTAAVAVLGFGAYQGIQWFQTPEADAVLPEHVLTQEELAQQAYEQGMALLSAPDRESDYSQAIASLTEAAELGHTGAMWTLVECYTQDKVVAQDMEQAFLWCSRFVEAAPKNATPEARYLLACCYREGCGTEKDPKAAIPHLQKAAEAGLVEAQYDLACCYASGEGGREDLAEAAKWFTAAGDQGHTGAMMELARRYREGKAGIAYTSNSDSLIWYKKAAEAGVPEAWHHVGLAHWEGAGTPQNREEAVSCFRKAAELGVPEAAFRLGAGIARGDIRGDATEAESLLKQAADAGVAGASCALADLYVRGINGKRNEAAAVPYYLQAARNGDQRATCSLAELWLSGFREGCTEATLAELLNRDAEGTPRARLYSALLPGVPRETSMKTLEDLSTNCTDKYVKADATACLGLMQDNERIAQDLFETAARGGSPLGEALLAYHSLMNGAQGAAADDALRILTRGADSRASYRLVLLYALGEVYLKGKGVEKDTAKGLELLEQAAASGELHALHLLAESYWQGSNGLEQDKAKAIETYQRAAQAGSPHAMAFLGHYYMTEAEGAPLYDEAEPYLAASAEAGNARAAYEYALLLRAKEPQNTEPIAQWAEKAADAGVHEALLILCDLSLDAEDATRANELLLQYSKSIGNAKPAPEAGAAWDRLGSLYEKQQNKAASDCWKKAADAKNPMGQFHYGKYLYENTNQKTRGKNFMEEAARAGVQEAKDYLDGIKSKSSSSGNNRNSGGSRNNSRRRR